MTAHDTNEALRERIKELSCLYDISTIASQSTDLTSTLQAIVERLTQAWQYADDAVSLISLNGQNYQSGALPEPSVSLHQKIEFGDVKGDLFVYYPAENYSESSFLEEEGQLLQKVAFEIASVAERYQHQANEEQLKRSLERTDRLKILGEITAGIAHELNTPLGNILGFSELIADNADNDLVVSDAEKIKSSALYAREVVKKLMYFSCEMPQQMESIALNTVVKDAIRLLTPNLQKDGIEIEFKPDPNNPFGHFDPIQITQVLFNLLINAAYASKSGSKISVELSSKNKMITIKIIDYGSGIPEEIHEKIFEPFFSTKGVGEGSGLGLSVVHGIVKSHKGTISFESKLGIGTTFTIRIPTHP